MCERCSCVREIDGRFSESASEDLEEALLRMCAKGQQLHGKQPVKQVVRMAMVYFRYVCDSFELVPCS